MTWRTSLREGVQWFRTRRVTLALIGFFGFVNLYALRVNTSIAVVCMVNQTAVELLMSHHDVMTNVSLDALVTVLNDTGFHGDDNDASCQLATGHKPRDGEFVWDKNTQGIVLGAFFWGYLVTQIPGGLFSQRWGGKMVLGVFMLLAALATLLSPVAATASPYALSVMRFLVGLGEGVVFPAMHDIWSKWAPPLERSKLIGFTHAGAQIGNVITLPISALLCENGFDRGWSSIYYVFGIFGVLWCVLWLSLVYDSPSVHPRISKEEKDYIESSVGTHHHVSMSSTPWLSFAKSMPVWAIIVAHTCCNWGTYTLLTNLPAYMKEVLKFDMKSNGMYSAIPYIVFWVNINLGGFVADFLRARGWTTRLVRKLLLGLGTIVPGTLLVSTGFIPCTNPTLAVAVLSMALGFCGFQFPAILVNHVDIAPPFAGVLFGISNTVATIPGFLAPYAVKSLTPHSTQEEWRVVFYIAAVIYAVGVIFYSIFGDGEVQSWALPFIHGGAARSAQIEGGKDFELNGLKEDEDGCGGLAQGEGWKEGKDGALIVISRPK